MLRTPPSPQRMRYCVLLLPLLLACQTFDTGLRRKIDQIDGDLLSASRVAFDHEALQVEVTCREDLKTCSEWAARVRMHVVDTLERLDAGRRLEAKHIGRLRIQVQLTQYWNVLNLTVAPLAYGVPTDLQVSEVAAQLEYGGKVYRGEGGAGCLSTWLIGRGPEGSSGCAVGEGVAEAINAALEAGTASTKETP